MSVLALAIKDLRIILRDKLGAFFIVIFPVLMGLFFGLVMGGAAGSPRGKMRVAVIDEDLSDWSRRFIEELARNENVELEPTDLAEGRQSVRRGNRVALIVIPTGFGEKAGIIWEEQPAIQVGVDPSRSAESAMLEGFLMQASGALIAQRFRDPSQFLPALQQARDQVRTSPDLDPVLRGLGTAMLDQSLAMLDALSRWQEAAADGEATAPIALQFVKVHRLEITQQEDPNSARGQLQKIRSRWDISFPQGMLWGIMGCAAGFAGSIAREEARGTLIRLRAAPLSKLQILLGKALACWLASIAVILLLTVVGTALGMRSDDYLKLAVGGLVVSLAFVGIMMTMSVLGRTEESVNGSGWAINMVMAMLGGGMVPVMFMPGFLQSASVVSPVFWSIRLIEGAIWRQFTWLELLPHLAILMAIGLLGTALGTWILVRRYQ